jgi:murein DD-endopeptidase MepM/ murein hydrolase activator NlpD
MGLNVGAIQNVSDADLNAIPLGNPLPAVQPPSTWQDPGLQFSTVTNKATGKALDAGGSNNSVYPHPLPNAANEFQQWGFQKVGDYYMIINKATGKALDAGGSNSTLPYIHHDPNTQNPFHLWSLQQVGDAYMIVNKATGKALDSGGDNGNQIYMYPTPMPSNPFHLWKLNLPDNGGGGGPITTYTEYLKRLYGHGQGKISQYPSGSHNAIDSVNQGSSPYKVYALASGKITTVTRDQYGGLYVDVWNDQLKRTFRYLHFQSFAPGLKVGQNINAGDYLGIEGYSGNSWPKGPAGRHTHFSIVANGVEQDPWATLRQIP